MDTLEQVKNLLRDALNMADRATTLKPESALLGGLPEFDSMAVVTVVTMIEDQWGISIEDDELSADIFATVASLANFIERKTER